MRVQANLLAVLLQRAEANLASVGLRRFSGCSNAEGDVGVLGVGENELATSVGVGMNRGQFAVERFFHGTAPGNRQEHWERSGTSLQVTSRRLERAYRPPDIVTRGRAPPSPLPPEPTVTRLKGVAVGGSGGGPGRSIASPRIRLENRVDRLRKTDAELRNALSSFGQSSISSCETAPPRPTTVGIEIQTSRMP